MQPPRAMKLRAHAEQLLDLFIGLREKYALLDPMVFDHATIQSKGAGQRARGFSILRNLVSMSCVLDIAKIAIDKDKRTPSISRLVQALEDPKLRQDLRESFAVRTVTPTSGYPPDVLEAMAAAERRDEDARRREFERDVTDVAARWKALERSAALKSFETIRDKHVAHAELHHDGNEYKPFDVTSLGLTWDDLRDTIAKLERLVVLLTGLYRGASFAFDMLDDQLARASTAFWSGAG